MTLYEEISHRSIFSNKQTDIVVTRINKKTKKEYTFLIAVIRPNGHVFVDLTHLKLFNNLQNNNCELITFLGYSDYEQLLVKD